jgi:protocatechuate 3,4-dioxygenase beta subunit
MRTKKCQRPRKVNTSVSAVVSVDTMRRASRLLFVTFLVTPFFAAAQDTEFIRALDRAQEQRPATLTTTARIAPESEPGTALVIHGRAFAADGRTPLAKAIIFAYHTDREGLYNQPGTPAHSWRLRGWALTDADGRFEFRTIKPGAYPSSRIPSHVHFTVFSDGSRYHAGELQFDDDTFLSVQDRTRSKQQGEFGSIRPIRREGPAEHVDFNIRLNPSQRF